MNTVKAVKVFVKDTTDLWKHQSRYMKSHWKGLIIISGVVIGAEIGTAYYQSRKWEEDRKRREAEYRKSVKEWEDRIKIEYEIEE